MITRSGCHTKHIGKITRQSRVNYDIKLNYEFITPEGDKIKIIEKSTILKRSIK